MGKSWLVMPCEESCSCKDDLSSSSSLSSLLSSSRCGTYSAIHSRSVFAALGIPRHTPTNRGNLPRENFLLFCALCYSWWKSVALKSPNLCHAKPDSIHLLVRISGSHAMYDKSGEPNVDNRKSAQPPF